MNRTDLQTLSQTRLADAQALIVAGQWAGAYYLAGYAVECALKACIAKRIQQHEFPDKQLAQDSYVHDLTKLRKVAGLEGDWGAAIAAAPALATNWTSITDWSERSRYSTTTTEQRARDFITACTAAPNGILTWIQNHW